MRKDGFRVRTLNHGIADYGFYRKKAERLRRRAKRAFALRLRRALRGGWDAALTLLRRAAPSRPGEALRTRRSASLAAPAPGVSGSRS